MATTAGWYPKDNSWTLQNGFKLRVKYDYDGNITDMLIADPGLSDDACHMEHLHVFNVQNPSSRSVTYSLKDASGRTQYRPTINGNVDIGDEGVQRFLQAWASNS